MTKFNIQTHIYDHAHTLYKGANEDIEGKIEHFNCSVDTTYFIANGYTTQQQIDEVMVNIFNATRDKEFLVEEKNGKFTNKNGEKKQKFRLRKIRFDNLSIAYHNEHFDRSKAVNPHFHFLIPSNARIGIGFTYLKQNLEEEAKKYNLKFHFMDTPRNTGLTKAQEKSINNLSWVLQQGQKIKLLSHLKDAGKLTRTLDLLVIHYENSLNISFFVKIMKTLHLRLNEFDMDFMFQGLNLKHEIPFYLVSVEKEFIENLQQSQHIQIDLSYVLDREILKYAYGFDSEAMEVLCDHFRIRSITPKQLDIVNDNLQITPKVKQSNSFRTLVVSDVQTAIDQAHSQKNLRELLINSGSYTKVTIKTQTGSDGKRKKIGFELTTQKKFTLSIPFHELGMDFSKIMMIMSFNSRNKGHLNKIKSKIKSYKNEKRETEKFEKPTLYICRLKLLLSIYVSSQQETDKTPAISEKLAPKYKFSRSQLYNITTFKSVDTTFVDYGDRITLKKCPYSIQAVIADMFDLAVLKGWELESIKITGDERFVSEAEEQIAERLGLDRETEQDIHFHHGYDRF